MTENAMAREVHEGDFGRASSDRPPPDERIGGRLFMVAWWLLPLLGLGGGYAWWVKNYDIAITFGIVAFTLLIMILGLREPWREYRYASIHWTLLNHQLPLVFVLLPPVVGVSILNLSPLEPSSPVAGGEATTLATAPPADATENGAPRAGARAGGEKPEAGYDPNFIAEVFFPAYYSLLVVVSTIFFNLQTEVEGWMKKLRDNGREADRWHAVSAVCLIVGLFAAVLYALPYIADILKFLQSPSLRAILFYFALVIASGLSLLAIWFRMNLEAVETRAEPESIEEKEYAY